MKKADELTELADEFGSDKGSSKHNYARLYHKYFKSIKYNYLNLFEIGYGKGASAKMWLHYFPYAVVYCMDIIKRPTFDQVITSFQEEGKFHFINGDQSSIYDLEVFTIENEIYKFDIVIDDGSHKAADQQISFSYLFPRIIKGGWYVIEDLDCRRKKKPGYEYAKTTLSILKKFKETGNFNSAVIAPSQQIYLEDNIAKVNIFNGKIAFIQKR